MRCLIILSALLLFSCSGTPINEPATHAEENDSLAQKLNSPELRALNGKILASPDDAALYQQRALIYLSMREYPAAVNDGKRAIRLDSTVAAYYLTLADVYFSQNSTRLAKELLEITEKKFPANTEALLKLAELFWLVRQYQKGLDYANKALKVDENMARAYYIKGGIYRESGDTSRAVSSLITAVEQDNTLTDAFYDLGVIFAARKNPAGLDYYENAIRTNGAHSDARYGKAKLLQDIGRTDEALVEYAALLKNDKSCGRCAYNMGAIVLEVRRDEKTALGHFTEAIRIEPDNPQYYFARAYTYSKLKDVESARADYKMCLRISPGFEPALEGLNVIEGK